MDVVWLPEEATLGSSDGSDELLLAEDKAEAVAADFGLSPSTLAEVVRLPLLIVLPTDMFRPFESTLSF